MSNSKLDDAIERYLKLRRSLGFKMAHTTYELRHLSSLAKKEGFDCVTNDLIKRWLQTQTTVLPSTRGNRLSMIRGFALWQKGNDSRTEIPPKQLTCARYERPSPYIYSDGDIRSLLDEALKLPSKLGWRAKTHAVYFGLLVVSGMRMAEALALDRDDVDLNDGIVTVRYGKLRKSRLVPVHESTQDALRSYAQARDTLFPRLGTPAFFVSEQKTRLSQWAVRYGFAKISSYVGLRRPFKGSRHGIGPRIHDLRHRFIVQTLIHWYRSGVDVERNMPKLSAYVGHEHINDTYWYIEAIPELLQLATKRLMTGAEGAGQ